MACSWASPSPKPLESPTDYYLVPRDDTCLRRTYSGWMSFQLFYACLVAKNILRDDSPASNVMKQALDDPLLLEPRMSDAYILGACDWIIAAGSQLYFRIVFIETLWAGHLAQWPLRQGAIPRERWESWKKRLKVLRRELGSDQRSLQDRLFEADQYMSCEIDQKRQEYKIFLASIRDEQANVVKWLGGV